MQISLHGSSGSVAARVILVLIMVVIVNLAIIDSVIYLVSYS